MVEIRLDERASAAEGALTQWFFGDGAVVAEGALLAEVMVEKATLEIIAPAGGRLTIVKPVDSVVTAGDLLAVIASP